MLWSFQLEWKYQWPKEIIWTWFRSFFKNRTRISRNLRVKSIARINLKLASSLKWWRYRFRRNPRMGRWKLRHFRWGESYWVRRKITRSDTSGSCEHSSKNVRQCHSWFTNSNRLRVLIILSNINSAKWRYSIDSSPWVTNSNLIGK